MEEDVNDFHREDFFLAQIACMVAKANMGSGGADISIKDFLIKFKTASSAVRKDTQQMSEDAILKKISARASWAKTLNSDQEGITEEERIQLIEERKEEFDERLRAVLG